MNALKNKRGFALVLVLIVIMLAATMAVFFLAAAGRERRGVDIYSKGSQVRHLAGMSVNRVMGQIGAATKEGTAATPVSWASQPGMIRTFDSSGSPKNFYKLYSWDQMVEAGGSFSGTSATQIPPSDWKSQPAVYTDLNQQINDVYPIVDPRAQGLVQGFSIDSGNAIISASGVAAPMPVKWLYVLEDGQMVAPAGSGNNVTIPGATANNGVVGRVAFWTDDETSKVNVNTASEGEYWDWPKSGSRDDLQFAGNPPVKGEFQRVAGHPSMTSLSAVLPELLTEDPDPTKTRWLSSFRTQAQALYGLTPRISWGGSLGGTYPVPNYADNYAPPSASVAARPVPVPLDTDRLYVSSDDFWFRPDRSANLAFTNLAPVADGGGDDQMKRIKSFQRRLFFLTANSRAPETTLFETPRVSLWPITWPWLSSYFVRRSISSPASVPSDIPDPADDLEKNPWMTAEEKLLAFCSTLNVSATDKTLRHRFYFQRQNPDSPKHDWLEIQRNQDLVEYVRREMETDIPGFGSNLAAKWNGGSGAGDSASWIALNIFDYSRSQINQYTTPTFQKGLQYSYTGASFRYGRINGVEIGTGADYVEPNAKAVTPLNVSFRGSEFLTQGAFPTLEEVAVMFYATSRGATGDPTKYEPKPPDNSGLAPTDPGYKDPTNPFNWSNLINSNSSNTEAIVDPVTGTTGYTNGTPKANAADTTSVLDDVGARTTEMRAVMLFDFTNLVQGAHRFAPVFWIKVTGGSFTVNNTPIGLPKTGSRSVQIAFNPKVVAARNTEFLTKRDDGTQRPKIFNNDTTGNAQVWTLVSDPIATDPNATGFVFGGGDITVEIYSCNSDDVDEDPTGNSANLIMTKVIPFGQWSGQLLPIPLAPRWTTVSGKYAGPPVGLPGATSPDVRPNPAFSGSTELRSCAWAKTEYAPLIAGKQPNSNNRNVDTWTATRSASQFASYAYEAGQIHTYESTVGSGGPLDPDDVRDSARPALLSVSTNFRKRVAGVAQRAPRNGRSEFFFEGATKDTTTPATTASSAANRVREMFMVASDTAGKESESLITPYDTVISMVANPATGAGDGRNGQVTEFRRIDQVMGAQPPEIVSSVIYPRATAGKQYHALGTPGLMPAATGYQNYPTFHTDTNLMARTGGDPAASGANLGDSTGTGGSIGASLGLKQQVPVGADWTTMPGAFPDGSTLVRPDQDYQQLYADASYADAMVPYYERSSSYMLDTRGTSSTDVAYFSPNRQVPSPILLGTLPSSLSTGWQTLAFSPNPANPNHPGLTTPPDHLLLDFFWMPVAEPYPISDQFSTAGKINLNYAIMPFSYIHRKTGLYALLKPTWLTALPDSAAVNYKSHYFMRQAGTRSRFAIDPGATLEGFDAKFQTGDIFRSASQLCEMFLVPVGESLSNVNSSYWSTRKLTADNAREEPYNNLYSRVTTKSNTFTVHWRVQSLRKVPGPSAGTWDESKDKMASELRGSTVIERFIDPNATDIPDYATNSTAKPLSQFYKWRVVSENFFQP